MAIRIYKPNEVNMRAMKAACPDCGNLLFDPVDEITTVKCNACDKVFSLVIDPYYKMVHWLPDGW